MSYGVPWNLIIHEYEAYYLGGSLNNTEAIIYQYGSLNSLCLEFFDYRLVFEYPVVLRKITPYHNKVDNCRAGDLNVHEAYTSYFQTFLQKLLGGSIYGKQWAIATPLQLQGKLER